MSDATKKVVIVKEVPNAVLYDDGTILLKNVRCSYPHLFKPQENKNDDGEISKSYSITCLMDKTTHEAAKKLCVAVVNDLLKDKGPKGEPLKIPAAKKFIKDGDPKDEDDAGKPENAGMWVVTARETKRPILLHRIKDATTKKLKRLSDDDKDVIYGGCYVNVLIRPWWQSNKYGKRVNAGVSSVQFYMDGEAFGSGRISDADVDDRFDSEDEAEVDVVDPADDL